jgi:type I restriction enzyme R subunit
VADRLLKQFAAAKTAHAEAIAAKDDAAAQGAKDTMDALILFRSDLVTYLRAYTFLSQIFDYGNTDFEKRAIFFKYLIRLLKFGREREGVDLSEVERERTAKSTEFSRFFEWVRQCSYWHDGR